MMLYLVVYSFALWFGLYLLARSTGKPGMRYAGMGMITYALGLGTIFLSTTIQTTPQLENLQILVTLLPSLFWLGAILHLVPGALPKDDPVWVYLFPAVPTFIVSIATLMLLGLSLVPAIPITLLVAALWLTNRALKSHLPRQPLTVIITGTLFFVLSVALLIIPPDWLSSELVVLAIRDCFVKGTKCNKIGIWKRDKDKHTPTI